jgi:hypothetical protein
VFPDASGGLRNPDEPVIPQSLKISSLLSLTTPRPTAPARYVVLMRPKTPVCVTIGWKLISDPMLTIGGKSDEQS